MSVTGSTGPLVLRRATDADLERVGEVTVAAYAPFTRGERDQYVARLRDAGARHRDAELWVACEGPDADGALLGSVTVCPPGSPWREVADADDTGEGEFRMLSVAPQAQGRGVGEALVRMALDRARAHGSTAVVLSSLRDMAAAHRLYERLGFRRVPHRDWAPLPGVDLIAYRLDLSPLDADPQERP